MLYLMPHIATAQYLNHSAMPHAPQVSDEEAHPVRDALHAVARAVTGQGRNAR